MPALRPILSVVSLALFLAAGTCPALAAPAPPEPVTIAIMAPLSGPAPSLGQSEQDGALLAIEQQNARGGLLGHKVAYQTWDTKCSPSDAQAAAQEAIVNKGLRYVIGEVCSRASLSISEIANQYGALQVTPASTDPQITINGDGTVKPYVFRACFTDPIQARAAAKFSYSSLSARKAFVLYNPADSYSKNLADTFMGDAASRGMAVQTATYASDTTDFSTMLTAATAMHADVVYLPDYYNVANMVTAQAPASGLSAPFLGGDGWDNSQLNASTANGDYFTNHYFRADDPRPEVQAFVEAFHGRFNYNPDVIAALAFDAANLMFQSVEAANTLDTGVVKTRMATMSFNEVTGKLVFDPLHNPIKTVAVYQLMDGGRHFYTSVDLIEPKAYLPLTKR